MSNAMVRSWYVEHNGKTVGPATSAQLKQLATTGKINRETRVKLGGEGEWTQAARVKGLFEIATIVTPRNEMVKTRQRQECRFCGETIAVSAIKCRHCNEFLDGRREMEPQPQWQPQSVVNVVTNVGGMGRQRWSPAVALLLSFFIPGLGQMYKGQVLNGIVWLVFTCIAYTMLVIPGLILHLCCVIGAATGDPYR